MSEITQTLARTQFFFFFYYFTESLVLMLVGTFHNFIAPNVEKKRTEKIVIKVIKGSTVVLTFIAFNVPRT